MSDNVLKIGVIGLGIGEQHINACIEMPSVEVATICDHNVDKMNTIGDKNQINSRVSDWRDIISNQEINVVTIASHDNNHAEQVISALENGKHVFVEKPICLSMEELTNIQSELNNHPELRFSSNLPLRTCPRFKKLRNVIRKKDMGEVYHIEADYLWGRPEKLVHGWRRDIPLYSIVLGASIHMIDLFIWLTGEFPTEVVGYGSKKALGQNHCNFDDFAVNLFRFTNGAIVKVSAHGGGAHPHHHNVRVYGTEKNFFHDINGAYWVDSRSPDAVPRVELSDYPARELRGRVLRSFLANIINPAQAPLVSCSDALSTMKIALAADHAIRDEKVQPIVIDQVGTQVET